ncbi:hypothetical protein [Mycetocola sp. 2940]|uniref:hypothetical protein n=1 Tax=Mycetocola sp. 2940 TaxID=3156452 RepID=UPI0033912653
MTNGTGFLGIHGINQREVTPQELTDEWTSALRSSLDGLGVSTEDVEVPVVFYADVFHPAAVAQGEEPLDDASALLLADWALDSIGVQAQGPAEQWVGQVARLIAGRLDDVPPWLVARLMRMGAREASDYLNDARMRRDIQGRLATGIATHQPRALIAHSLGSVVAWETMQAIPDLRVELLLTIGSPLALPNAMLSRLDPQPVHGRTKPPGVGRWVNVVHPGDLVAAAGRLRSAFPEVDEEFEIDVDLAVCHRAESYLTAPVAAGILSPYR